MTQEKGKDISDLFGLLGDDSVPEQVDITIEKSDARIQEELEQEKEIAEARREFEEKGLTFGEYVNDEGNIEVGIYTRNSKGTPINKLMELCEADLPYVDKETRKDYEDYHEEFGIKYKDYDGSKMSSDVEDFFD